MSRLTLPKLRRGEPLAVAPWHAFFDVLSDAVVVFDAEPRVVFANIAALRLLPCDAGTPIGDLAGVLGSAAVEWLRRAAQRLPVVGSVPDARLPDGRVLGLAWRRLDEVHSALRLAPPVHVEPVAPHLPHDLSNGLREVLRVFWESPFPVLLQDDGQRIVDVNPAFLAFCGLPRERLVGTDPIALQPEADREESMASRQGSLAGFDGPPGATAMPERRLIDAEGRERWFRASRRVLRDEAGALFHLSVMQDSTAEHIARARADHSLRELDDWFDLSPVGMVLLDQSGLLVRTNPAFEALVGTVPVLVGQADPQLQQLLGFEGGQPLPALRSGAAAIECRGWIGKGTDASRRLRAVVRCYRSAAGRDRYMAVVEDRSVEEERDLAQMQIGAMMETAGVGLATFQESVGWVRQRHREGREGPAGAGASTSVALQSIKREIVVPESLPSFERLQSALRRGERAEVRYAIRHPELGQRWLLTRVEPAVLGSGQRTTSVVTLDVTEQQQAQERSEQLLHELGTILESTTAGIAYLRENVLVRCNRRFEAMLGLGAGQVAGASVQELFGRHASSDRIAADIDTALAQGDIYEIEFERIEPGPAPARLWYALSVRGAGAPAGGYRETIAVLSDVTRLKTQQIELQLLLRDRELMFSLSEVGIAYVREDRIQRANDALAHLLGCSVDDLFGLELAALFPDPLGFQRAFAREQVALEMHGRWSGERQLRRSDGRLVWAQVSTRLVVEGDLASGFIASYVNVDARHRAERSVALQAERTRAILDSVLVGIVTVGPHGIEWMNRSARRMFGGELRDFLGQPISTVATADDDHPFRRTQYLDDLVEGRAETFECQVLARDGRAFWVVGNAVATGREATGRQLTYALLDIERRRQAEAGMTQAQASLQRVIEAAPLAITLRDAATLKILQINQLAAQSLHADAPALIGRTPEQIFKPPIAAERRRHMQQALGSSQVTLHEYRFTQAGRPQVWDARYLPLASAPGGAPDQLLVVATDVTEQRAAAQAQLDAAIAQREMLVKEVHHRIKNNLQGVAGLLQQIAQRKPEVAGVIAEVVGQVQAIAQVYGLQVGVSGPLRLASVVEAIAASVQRTFGRTIRFERLGVAADAEAWSLPEAESIPVALTLNELLTNAVKHAGATAPADAGAPDIVCTLASSASGACVRIVNPGRLPAGFNLAGYRGGVSGLGLVRALLPRRSARLELVQQGDAVCTTVELAPPGLVRLTPPETL
ncbi:MAG: PAS domain S-box protein [Burkholderiaceae bacterium]